MFIIAAAPLFLSRARRPQQGRASPVHPSREPLRKHRDDRRRETGAQNCPP